MKGLLVTVGVLAILRIATAEEVVAVQVPTQWSAGNSDQMCMLSRFVGSDGNGVALTFIVTSSFDGSKTLKLSAGGAPSGVVWPVTIELSGDRASRSFEIGADPAVLPLLLGKAAQAVLDHLRSGGTLLVHYQSADGSVARAVFGSEGFKQSDAMFVACIEGMSPNNALEQTRGQRLR